MAVMRCINCDDLIVSINGIYIHILIYGCIECKRTFYCKSDLFTHQFRKYKTLYAPYYMLYVSYKYLSNDILIQLIYNYNRINIYNIVIYPYSKLSIYYL